MSWEHLMHNERHRKWYGDT